MSNRHLARTIAMQTLYFWDFNGQQEKNIDMVVKKNLKEFAPGFDDEGFSLKTVQGVIENLAEEVAAPPIRKSRVDANFGEIVPLATSQLVLPLPPLHAAHVTVEDEPPPDARHCPALP